MLSKTRNTWLFLLGSSTTKRAFLTSDVTHPDVTFSTGKSVLFTLHQLSSQTPVATGFLHTRTHLSSGVLDTYVFSGKAWFLYGQPGILSVFWLQTACPENLLAQKIYSFRLRWVPRSLPFELELHMDYRAPSISSPAAWACFRTSFLQFSVSLWCQNASPVACTLPPGCRCSLADLKSSCPNM